MPNCLQLMPSDLQTSIAAGDGTSSSASVLLTSSVPSKTIPTSPPTTATLSVSSSASPSSTRPKGMQLGGSKVQQSVATLVLAEEWTEDAIHGKDANPWGTDDLIDIDADQDDWSAFSAFETSARYSRQGFQLPSRLLPMSIQS